MIDDHLPLGWRNIKLPWLQ